MSDDLLDTTPEPPKRRRGRPPKKETESKAAAPARRKMDASVVQALHQPVSITFLCEVMKMDRKNVTKRLAPLAPLDQHRGQSPLYDFRQAMQYLVTPRGDIAQTIKRLGTEDLPNSLQKDVWDARLKEQKWKANAGELWHTSTVLDVLTEAFQRLKSSTQLWIDQVSDNHMLPPEARKELTELVDALQADLHRTLVKMPEDKATKSQAGDMEDFEGDG